jgi:hypothetical protein
MLRRSANAGRDLAGWLSAKHMATHVHAYM